LHNPKTIAFVVFTGGEDVTPSFYKEEPHQTTCNNLRRDMQEQQIFELALKRNIPMVGICRGSQFLCAMSGGKLVQNIRGHGGNHNVRTIDGRLISVTSTHHQMQLPPVGATVIAWAEPSLSNIYEGITPHKDIMLPEREYDCVYYPQTRALGMQYHPEYMSENSEGFLYCQELVEEYILKSPE
jgi:putative glutamine amidotransferase